MLGRRRQGLRESNWNDAWSDGTDSTTQWSGKDLAANKREGKDELIASSNEMTSQKSLSCLNKFISKTFNSTEILDSQILFKSRNSPHPRPHGRAGA